MVVAIALVMAASTAMTTALDMDLAVALASQCDGRSYGDWQLPKDVIG